MDYISGLKYKEIDCVGFSGGGQSALWLTANGRQSRQNYC